MVEKICGKGAHLCSDESDISDRICRHQATPGSSFPFNHDPEQSAGDIMGNLGEPTPSPVTGLDVHFHIFYSMYFPDILNILASLTLPFPKLPILCRVGR